MRQQRLFTITTSFVFLLFLVSCAGFMGNDKSERQVLITEVQSGQDAMVELKQELQSAKREFEAVEDINNSNLEQRSDRIEKNYDKTKSLSKSVRENIDGIQEAANEYFEEWESDLEKYTNTELRNESRERLEAAREKYSDLNQGMSLVNTQIKTTMPAFKDRVLFVRHSMVSSADGRLEREITTVNESIDELINDLQAAVDKTDQFIQDLRLKDSRPVSVGQKVR